MSADPVSVTIQVLDKEYVLLCPPEEREGLLASARELNERMQELRSRGKVLGAERMAVMTALTVIHEREQLKSLRARTFASTQETIRRLENKLDAAIGRRDTARPLDS